MTVRTGSATLQACLHETSGRRSTHDSTPKSRPETQQERAERSYSPAEAIADVLGRRVDRYVVCGTSGSGLSTELYRISENLAGAHLLVLLDVHGHFNDHVHDPAALDNVQPWEILMLVGLGIVAAGKERFGHKWAAQDIRALEAATRELAGDEGANAEIDILKLSSSMAVLAGGAVGGVAGAVLSAIGTGLGAGEWTMPIGVSKRNARHDQDRPVRALLDAVNHLVDVLQQAYGRSLVVAVDGLDRIRNHPTAEAIFVRSSLLANLICPTVAVGPLSLCRRGRLSSLRGWQPKVLANAPVLMRETPLESQCPGPGVRFLDDVFRRRVEDLGDPESFIPHSLLQKMAFYSGGRTREFVRFVRIVADKCSSQNMPVANTEAIDKAIDERRRAHEQGLNRRHIDLLRTVMDDPQHVLPDDEHVEEMLDNWWLLPYPNESEWYYPHPLLTLSILK